MPHGQPPKDRTSMGALSGKNVNGMVYPRNKDKGVLYALRHSKIDFDFMGEK